MSDVAISPDHNEYRLLGTLAHLDSATGNARLKVFSGVQPAPGGSPTTLLVTVPLTKPAGAIVAGVLLLQALNDFDLAVATGVATWARLENGDGEWNSDLAVGAAGSGKPVQFDNVSLLAGGKVSPTLMALG